MWSRYTKSHRENEERKKRVLSCKLYNKEGNREFPRESELGRETKSGEAGQEFFKKE